MKRRDFILTAGGTAAATAPATAQQNNSSAGGNQTASNASAGNMSGGNQTNQTGGGSSGGPTKQVAVGPNGNFVFDPEDITIEPGTTVNWTWESDNHNIVLENQPEESNWEGTSGPASKTYDTGHSYTHTFSTTGTYEYFCQPHKNVGMVGSVTVQEGGASSGGSGEEQQNPEEMGVPFQAHFVGIATILMMVVSLVYTFFSLKYGESPNAKGGNN